MKLLTQIELNLTISNINSIYTNDFNNMILQECKKKYENKCLDEQYIISINKVIKRSMSNLIHRDLDAKIRIYVIVEALVMRFDKYDVITNMIVNKIIPKNKIGIYDLLECSNENCKALIKLDSNLTEYKINDIIPIKIGSSLLKILNSQVLINAYPFVPHKMEKNAYYIHKSLNKETKDFTNLVSILESKLKPIENNLNSKRYIYFDKLLYPFKEIVKNHIGKSVDLIQFVNNIDHYEDKYVYIDQTINLSELKVSILTTDEILNYNKKNNNDNNDMIMINNNTSFISILLFTFIKHIDLLNDLITTYSDDNVFEQHKYLWKLYESYKF